MTLSPYQLLKIVLYSVGVNNNTYCYQSVKSKVKELVAEERNDPCSMLLKEKKEIFLILCTNQ